MTICENDMAQFVVFSINGSNVKSGKKCNMNKYFLFCVTFLTVEVKLKLTTWKSDRQMLLLKTNFHFTFVTD